MQQTMKVEKIRPNGREAGLSEAEYYVAFF